VGLDRRSDAGPAGGGHVWGAVPGPGSGGASSDRGCTGGLLRRGPRRDLEGHAGPLAGEEPQLSLPGGDTHGAGAADGGGWGAPLRAGPGGGLMYRDSVPGYVVLKDGTVFAGFGFAAQGRVLGEVVFNTSMTGYQEVVTDPSYHGQMVVF